MTKENPFSPLPPGVFLVACWHQFFCSLSITNASRLPLPLCFPVLSLALFSQEALQHGQYCREKDKSIMPPAKSFATTLSYELPKHDREAMAGRQDKQSITSLHAINNQLGFASSRFLCCADPNHYFFSPTEHSLVKVMKEKTMTEIWWQPVRIQDNCSPGTGETVKTDQVRTIFHQWCLREEQIASSKPWLMSSKQVSFPLQLRRCEHSGLMHTHTGGLGPRPHARSPQEQVLPLLLHGQEASTSVILPPLGTFTHPLQSTKPCSSFHSCLLLLSKGQTSVASATAPWAAISSASTLRLSASSREHSHPDYSLNITQPEQPFWFITSPLNYFSVIIYRSNTHTNSL